MHIYDAAAKSWSTQKVDAGSFDTSSFKTILDHDTNVFYAISHGEMWSLDLGEQKAAKSDKLQWTDVQTTPYGSDYDPTMALAQNHIHFIGVPDVPAGSADIFVIHCESSYTSHLHIWPSLSSVRSLVLPAATAVLPRG